MSKLLKRLTDALRPVLASNELWAAKALIRVWENQTADEQASESTYHQNGVGFSGLDAQFGSSLALRAVEWFNTPKDERRYASPFSANQAVYAKRMAAKYAGQVARHLLATNPQGAIDVLTRAGDHEAAGWLVEDVIENDAVREANA